MIINHRAYYYYYNRTGIGGVSPPFTGGDILVINDNKVSLRDADLGYQNVFLEGSDIVYGYLLWNCVFCISDSKLFYSENRTESFIEAPGLIVSGLKICIPVGDKIILAGDGGINRSVFGTWSWESSSSVTNITGLEYCNGNLICSTSDASSLNYSTDLGDTWVQSSIPSEVNGCSSVRASGGKIYAVVRNTVTPGFTRNRLLVSVDDGITFTDYPHQTFETDAADFYGEALEIPFSNRIVYATSIGTYTGVYGSSLSQVIVDPATSITRRNEVVYITTTSGSLYHSSDHGYSFNSIPSLANFIFADTNYYVTSNGTETLLYDNDGHYIVLEENISFPPLTNDLGEILTDDNLEPITI